MNNNKTLILLCVVFFLAFGFSLATYSRMPAEVVSHWNAAGQPDGSMSRFGALFLIPMMMIAVSGLLMFLPAIDPLKENIARFRPSYNVLIVIVAVYLLFIHVLVILWNLGVKYDMNMVMVPAISVLFFATGSVLKKARRNWFIGVRTPWTLSSDTVWQKTHQRAAILFKIYAAIILIGLLLPNWFLYLLLVPLLLMMIYLMAFSYLLFRQENRKS